MIRVSDGIRARIGSLTAGLDRFAPWRTVDGSGLDDTGRSELEVMICGVFTPERFLDLVVDYIAFEVVDGVVKSKKLAGYHQFHAVRKALTSTIEAAGEHGQRLFQAALRGFVEDHDVEERLPREDLGNGLGAGHPDGTELEERIAWELANAPHADVLVGVPAEAQRA